MPFAITRCAQALATRHPPTAAELARINDAWAPGSRAARGQGSREEAAIVIQP